MAGNLPLIELIDPLIIALVVLVTTFFVFYKYFQFEKKRSDLIIGIAFLLFTLGYLANLDFFNDFFFDNGFGGIHLWFRLLGFLVFFIVIEPMEVINHFLQGRSGEK